MRKPVFSLFVSVALLSNVAIPIPAVADDPSDLAVAPGMEAAAAAGFYKMQLGAFTVTALLDGVGILNVTDELIAHKPGLVEDLLSRARLPDELPTAVNAYLIDTGNERVLIDVGSGNDFVTRVPGNLQASLEAAGYRPEDIDRVLLTHLHPDHVGGLVRNGLAAFPRAMVFVDEREVDYWLDQSVASGTGSTPQSPFTIASLSLKPYIENGRLRTFRAGQQLMAGVITRGFSVVSTRGHSAGHTSYLVQSQGQTMLFWGDLVHIAAIQFYDPTIVSQHDSKQGQASGTFRSALADATEKGYWVAASHIAFPGIGHVERSKGERGAYDWRPIPPDR